MEPSWVSKMDIAPNWLPPKPSNQGPSVIGVEPPRRWPISCHGVGTMIWIKPYHGVCGFCGKRRLQQIEAYMNLWVSWVSTAFWVKTKGYHIVCWQMVYLHTRFAHSEVPLRFMGTAGRCSKWCHLGNWSINEVILALRCPNALLHICRDLSCFVAEHMWAPKGYDIIIWYHLMKMIARHQKTTTCNKLIVIGDNVLMIQLYEGVERGC